VGGIEESRVRTEVGRWVRQLDSERFDQRREAAAKLQQLKARPELWGVLAEEFQRVLVAPGTSFEVRREVERLRAGLPVPRSPPAEPVSPREIDNLLGQVEDERYAVRIGATRRLEWLLENPRTAHPILECLKRRLDREDLGLDARRWLEPIHAKARGAWLSTDPATWKPPPVSDEQIAAWLDDLSRRASPVEGARASRSQEKAVRELRDLLAHDPYVPKIKAAIEARLKQHEGEPEAVARLRELADLTRPAMVAEYWQGRRHLNTQHLWLGMPSHAPGADRPSHFDFIDDKTAHCVSGQNLLPGDYAVGVAIPHPKDPSALFHLVNLGTPRHKMVYASLLAEGDEGRALAQLSRIGSGPTPAGCRRRDERAGLAQLSRRTLERWLAARQRLSTAELALLLQLDADEVSRFAGEYFLAVDDQAVPEPPAPAEGERPPLARAGWFARRPFSSGRASGHGVVCEVLAAEGRRSAVPGLLKAIEAGRFQAPTPDAPYQLPWIAALAIAARDPWPGVDPWLASLVARGDPLVMGRSEGPELGATAAAILLARQRQDLGPFGLKEVEDPLLDDIGLAGYRFRDPAGRDRVQRWRAEQQGADRPAGVL